MNDPYENLANAIVLSAVTDYREALARCRLHSAKESFQQEREDIERFFRSGWFGVLTKLDPEVLIRKLREEVA